MALLLQAFLLSTLNNDIFLCRATDLRFLLVDLPDLDASDQLPDIARLIPLHRPDELCQPPAPPKQRATAMLLDVQGEHLGEGHAHVDHLVVGEGDEVAEEVRKEERLRGRVEQGEALVEEGLPQVELG